jgi:glycosyltransferase involved in cell wall biosynthesis
VSETVSFAIVSYDIRRDLHDPLRFFEVLKPIHFFQRAPYRDAAATELEGAYQFGTPAELYAKLRRTRPQIVQGGEAFVRRLVPTAWAVLAYSRLHRRPYIVPSVENLPVAGKYGPAWAAAMRASIRPYIRGATLDIAINAGAEANLRWAGARPERIRRLMYGTWGVDTIEFAPEGPRQDLPGSGAKIVFLGRIHREKGVFDLLEAMPAVLARVDADLVLLGDGPDRQAVADEAQRAGLTGKVHLLGTVQNKDVPSFLRAASVLAAPSVTTQKWAEQVGMSAIQALACGVPVVTTPSGSIAEFIENGVTGMLVPESDPPALAAALTRLLTGERLRREFASRARAEAIRRFDARTNIRTIEQTILQACGFRR